MNNIVVRKLIKDSGLHYWQIAEKIRYGRYDF